MKLIAGLLVALELTAQALPLGGIPVRPTGGGVITSLTNTCAGGQGGTTGSTVSCTWSAAPPAGASIVCLGATFNGGTGTLTAMSISDGTAYTNANAGGSGIFKYAFPAGVWYLTGQYRFNIGTTAPATVTLTLTGATDRFASILCNAFTDTGPGPTLDGTCSFASGSGGSTATESCSSAIVTTGPDYVIATGATSAGTVTPGTGWTTGSSLGGQTNAYQVQTAAGSITPTFTGITTGQNAGLIGLAAKP